MYRSKQSYNSGWSRKPSQNTCHPSFSRAETYVTGRKGKRLWNPQTSPSTDPLHKSRGGVPNGTASTGQPSDTANPSSRNPTVDSDQNPNFLPGNNPIPQSSQNGSNTHPSSNTPPSGKSTYTFPKEDSEPEASSYWTPYLKDRFWKTCDTVKWLTGYAPTEPEPEPEKAWLSEKFTELKKSDFVSGLADTRLGSKVYCRLKENAKLSEALQTHNNTNWTYEIENHSKRQTRKDWSELSKKKETFGTMTTEKELKAFYHGQRKCLRSVQTSSKSGSGLLTPDQIEGMLEDHQLQYTGIGTKDAAIRVGRFEEENGAGVKSTLLSQASRIPKGAVALAGTYAALKTVGLLGSTVGYPIVSTVASNGVGGASWVASTAASIGWSVAKSVGGLVVGGVTDYGYDCAESVGATGLASSIASTVNNSIMIPVGVAAAVAAWNYLPSTKTTR